MKRAVLLLAVLVLAACGGGGGGNGEANGAPLSKADYEAKVQQILTDVGQQFASTTTEENSPEALEEAGQALDAIADELEKINPPEEIAELHRDLVDGARGLAEELPGLAEKLEGTDDPTEAITLLFGMESIQKLAKVQEELKKAGYEVGTDQTETTP